MTENANGEWDKEREIVLILAPKNREKVMIHVRHMGRAPMLGIGSNWTCEECDARNAVQATVCWACGAVYPAGQDTDTIGDNEGWP